jgi:hypothetical protein
MGPNFWAMGPYLADGSLSDKWDLESPDGTRILELGPGWCGGVGRPRLVSGGVSTVCSFLRTVWACAIGFPPIAIEAEDGFAELVAFDGKFSGLSEGAA